MLRLLLVDDHALFSEGLRALLAQRMPLLALQTVRRAADALELLRRGDELDLLLVDQRLPDLPGLELLHRAAELRPEVARLLISGADDPTLPGAARAAGATGFLHKSADPDHLVRALQAVVGGESWFGAAPSARTGDALPTLPPRARQALVLLLRGLSNRDIAEHMGIGERAVKQHLSLVFATLGVDSRAQAIVAARRLRLSDDA